MLYSIVLFVFVIVCLLLVGIILLQTSQSGGMGSIGGGNNFLDGALGSQGADSLLLKTTTVLAIIFMSLAILINIIDNPGSEMNYSTESVIMKNKSDETIPGASDPIKVESTLEEESSDEKELKVAPSSEK
jgi:preprotein translocase subunit SecG